MMLPKLSGLDVCRSIRSQSDVPIIIVTAKGDEIDTVVALEVGADDYVTKPYRMRELVARMRAVLRRSGRGRATEGTEAPTEPDDGGDEFQDERPTGSVRGRDPARPTATSPTSAATRSTSAARSSSCSDSSWRTPAGC